VQVWFDDKLAHNNNACRGRGAPGVCQDTFDVIVTSGVHRIIVGTWERGGGFGCALRSQKISHRLPRRIGTKRFRIADCHEAWNDASLVAVTEKVTRIVESQRRCLSRPAFALEQPRSPLIFIPSKRNAKSEGIP